MTRPIYLIFALIYFHQVTALDKKLQGEIDNFLNARRICEQESGVDPGTIQNAGSQAVEENQKLYDFFVCVFQMFKILETSTQNQGLHFGTIVGLDEVNLTLKNCVFSKDAALDAAFDYSKCAITPPNMRKK